MLKPNDVVVFETTDTLISFQFQVAVVVGVVVVVIVDDIATIGTAEISTVVFNTEAKTKSF